MKRLLPIALLLGGVACSRAEPCPFDEVVKQYQQLTPAQQAEFMQKAKPILDRLEKTLDADDVARGSR